VSGVSGTGQGRRFDATAQDGRRGRLLVPVPFDPDQVWGSKPRHHVGGTLDGFRVRGVVEAIDGGFGFTVGAAWVRDCPVAVGDMVAVEITPEGPQRGELAEDVAAALDASPRAGEFFDGLAQFYRKGYLRWIDATKRRPEERAARIAELVRLLEAGKKERPKQ
jgi:hypothetical protein